MTLFGATPGMSTSLSFKIRNQSQDHHRSAEAAQNRGRLTVGQYTFGIPFSSAKSCHVTGAIPVTSSLYSRVGVAARDFFCRSLIPSDAHREPSPATKYCHT